MKTTVFIITMAACALTACTVTNYTANMSGASDYATVAVKDFVTLGIVTVTASEIHYSSPFALHRRIEGSKITFADLLQEAAKLEADDIINIRIDMNADYTKSFFDVFSGWSRTYNYTGTALAIKYTERLESGHVDPQLSGIPKTPEAGGVAPTSRTGQVTLP